MKARIELSDDNGNTYSGDVVLAPTTGQRRLRTPRPATPTPAATTSRDLDFTLSSRAFIRKHAALADSGAKKFVLLLSWIAKGKTDRQVDGEALRKEWDKVRGPIGADYQTMSATRARDNGWIDSPKHGVFKLARDWKRALSG